MTLTVPGSRTAGQTPALPPPPLHPRQRERRPPHPVRRALGWVALLAALVCFVCTAVQTDVDDLGDFGLVSALPLAYAVGIVIVTVAFVVEVLSRSSRRLLLGGYTGALLLLLYGVAPVLYSLPRYAWTYKHLAVVNALEARGGLDRTATIYDNWAGFFGGAASLNGLLHIDVVRYAAWAELFFAVLEALAVGYLVRGLSDRRAVVFGTVWVFTATNWVGQNYFAPQPFAFVLVVLALGVAVRHLASPTGPRFRSVPGMVLRGGLGALSPRRGAGAVRGAIGHAQAVLASPRALRDLPWPSTAVLAVLVLHTAVVVSHQLSPFMAIALFGGLALVAGLRPVGLVVAMVVITLLWVVLAGDYLLAHTELFGFTSNVAANAGGVSAQRLVREPEAGQLVALAARGLSLSVWGLASLGALWAAVRRRVDRRVLVLAFVPLGTVLVNGYGGEAVYRVFLFSLPGMAFLVASLLFGGPPRRWRAPVAVVLLLALTASFVVAAFGRDRVNQMHPGEPELLAWIEQSAPEGSVVAMLFPNAPGLSGARPERFVHPALGFTALPPRTAEQPTYTAEELCGAGWMWARESPSGSAYLVVSASQAAYAEGTGYARRLVLSDISEGLESCGYFRSRFKNDAGEVWQVDWTTIERGGR